MFKKIMSFVVTIGLLLCLGKVAMGADFVTMYNLGMAKVAANTWAAARADFQSALVLAITNGDIAAVQFIMGYIYEREGDYTQAKIWYAKIKNDAYHEAWAQSRAGYIYEAEGNIVEAEKAHIKTLVDPRPNPGFGKGLYLKIKWSAMNSEPKARLLLVIWKNIPTPAFSATQSADAFVKQTAQDTIDFKGAVVGALYELLGLPKDAGIVQAEAKIKELWN